MAKPLGSELRRIGAACDRLGAVFEDLKSEPAAQVTFARRMADACAVQALQSVDLGREIEVRAA